MRLIEYRCPDCGAVEEDFEPVDCPECGAVMEEDFEGNLPRRGRWRYCDD